MDIESFREYCIKKAGVAEGFPFDDSSLVFKVGGKMFALLDLENSRINLKCDPEKAIGLREQYTTVKPGYHMNKAHWNSIDMPLVADHLIKEWTDWSYDLVFKKLPRRIQQEYTISNQ